ncbi:MAG: hypothetical protein M3020_14285 [Myxococcota bacterium]|nr:hypothetical protein [Myxococcota bacterium]
MKIRSRVLAVRVALVASAILAFPGLDLTGVVPVRSAQAAGKKPTVALGAIEGKKSKDVRRWVLDSMEKDYEVTDAEEVVPKSGGDAGYAKSAKALGTEWVVTGKVDGNKLVLTVRDGVDGSVFDTVEIKGAGAKLKKAIAKDLPSSMADAMSEEEEAEEEEAPKPKKTAAKASKGDEETEAETESESEEEEAPADDSEPEEEAPAEDAAASESKPSSRPGLVLYLGVEGTRRDFTYKDQLHEHNPPECDLMPPPAGINCASQLSDYHLPLQPGGFLSLELYPIAFFSDGFLSNVGLTFQYHQGLTTKSSYTRKNPVTMLNETQEFDNVHSQWAAGARIRFPFDTLEVGAQFAYGVHKFFLKGDEDSPIIPDVKYGFVKLAVDGTVSLGKVSLGARVGVRMLGSLGELESLWFPGATGTGLDAGLMGVYSLTDSLGLALGVDIYRYGFDFNAIPTNNVVVAGGAVDQYLSGWLGIRWQLGGGASAAAGGGAVAVSADASSSDDSGDDASDDTSEDEEEE